MNRGGRLCRFPRMEENRPVPDCFHDAGVVMFLKMFVMDSTVSSSSWMIVEARMGRGDVMVEDFVLVVYGRYGDRLREYCVSKQQYLFLCGSEEEWFFKELRKNYSCCRHNVSCNEELTVIVLVGSILWM